MKRGPVKGRSHDGSSRYCSDYPRNCLVSLSFLWFVPLAFGPCPWLFLIGLHKSSILHSRRGRVLSFQLSVGAAAKLLQSCPTLSGPMDCSPPGSSSRQEYWSGVPLLSPVSRSSPLLFCKTRVLQFCKARESSWSCNKEHSNNTN